MRVSISIKTALAALRIAVRDTAGTAAIEFAIIGPILLVMMIGLLEFARVLTTGAVLELAAREASRYGITGSRVDSQEPLSDSQRQARILRIIEEYSAGMVDMARLGVDVKAYTSFENIGKPEPAGDSNGDGRVSPGEFIDVNQNGVWDDDMGKASAGGANEVVVYTLSYDQPLVTSLMTSVLGLSAIHHEARVVVRNEPF